ncbi:MAG: hypothetical protein H6R02_342 [Burkholderiaceae bacterium]|jgi:hypothetical protein|nr:hypothetical protein [Burkholderiaceae bacterium]
MQTYVVRRSNIAATAAELDAALTRLRSFEEKPHSLNARWIRSYALREADGRFGLACVFQSDSVQTLKRHAELTRAPAQEILPVATTVLVRPFAPTMVYLIRRRNFWKTAADLEKSAVISRRVGDQEMARQVSWLHTFAVTEKNGSLGTVCLYQAVDPEALRKHAARVGMPADEIVPVFGRIVFRDDPQQQPAPTSAVPA